MKKSTKSIIVVILAAILGYFSYTKFCNNESCEENCENKDSVTVATPAADTTVKAETTTTVAATDSTKN